MGPTSSHTSAFTTNAFTCGALSAYIVEHKSGPSMGPTTSRTGSHPSAFTTCAFTCGAFSAFIVEHKSCPSMGFTSDRTGSHTSVSTTSAFTCGAFPTYIVEQRMVPMWVSQSLAPALTLTATPPVPSPAVCFQQTPAPTTCYLVAMWMLLR